MNNKGMVDSRESADEIEDDSNTSVNEELEQQQDTNEDKVENNPPKPKWEFSEARQNSLRLAREKAKQLREELKQLNPTKEKKMKPPTKLQQNIKQLKEPVVTPLVVEEPIFPPKVEVAERPPPTVVSPIEEPEAVEQKLREITDTTSTIIQRGKFYYI